MTCQTKANKVEKLPLSFQFYFILFYFVWFCFILGILFLLFQTQQDIHDLIKKNGSGNDSGGNNWPDCTTIFLFSGTQSVSNLLGPDTKVGAGVALPSLSGANRRSPRRRPLAITHHRYLIRIERADAQFHPTTADYFNRSRLSKTHGLFEAIWFEMMGSGDARPSLKNPPNQWGHWNWRKL